jgi:hypothetical protein
LKEGSRKGASLSLCRSSVRVTWREGSFAGIQKDMGKRTQGMGISLSGDPTEEPGRRLVYRGLTC